MRVVIGADFNGEGNRGDEEVMGKFGVKERNLEGQMVVDFAKKMDMAVVNTYFQKREAHRVTYKSGGRRTQVVLPDDWETTAEVIRETGRKVLGVSSGRRKEDKETWWWNEEVQDSIQRKSVGRCQILLENEINQSIIHSRLSDLLSGHGEPVPISGVIGHQGRIHPGRSANPSQGTHTLSFTHTMDNLEMQIKLQCMSLDQWRKPEYLEETPKTRGEHANSTHTAEAGIKPPTLEM
ncbi:hypothetical protein QTP70_020921 [Hemibagrus guttatus]|uniref:Endonuclease/exonuclease/phosphatase domain-containing protein n=1 Tax=Hemibagrus guttatus TaxID=175788 RepID=A0AAE0R589_9TELE|nr:hypothetical protein QTP70_020921 [Hemibagrus guttatus]